jgi:hypothetical protein
MLKIFLNCLILAVFAFSQSNITDENWVMMTGPNGLGAYPITTDKNGNLLAGGMDTSSGAIKYLVARWSGTTWEVICGNINNKVSAIVEDDSGRIYIGGQFDSVGNIKANYIAFWNGANWKTLGNGTNGKINALAIDKIGNLIAGGQFDSAGDIRSLNIAKWNGLTWNALDTNNFHAARSITINDSNDVYVCFTDAIAKWDGKKWNVLMNLLCTGICIGNVVLADNSDTVYAGGGFGFSYTGVEKSSRETNYWASVGNANWAASPNNGEYTPWYVSALAFDSAGNLFAGGHFINAGGTSALNIARWDGNTWKALGSGLKMSRPLLDYPIVDFIAVDRSDNLYVEGIFDSAGGMPVSGFAKCNLKGTSIAFQQRKIAKSFLYPLVNTNKINFYLTKYSQIHYGIFDIRGQKIFSSKETGLGPGKYEIKSDNSNLTPGTYILDFQVDAVSYKTRFNLIR